MRISSDNEIRAGGTWPLNCVHLGMQPLNYRVCSCCVSLLIFSIMQTARGNDLSIPAPPSPRAAAFARYIATLQEQDPLAASGATGILIEASLPELYKEASLLVIRASGENHRSRYLPLQIKGDGTVVDEVIARYAALQEHFEDVPAAAVAISPANYKFRFAGQVKTGGAAAYVYQITPRKRRPGAFAGQLWMDCNSGRQIMLRGHMIDAPSIGGHADLVRDTKLRNGSAYARVSHLAFSIPRLGRSELVITELVLSPADELQQPERLEGPGDGPQMLRQRVALLGEHSKYPLDAWSTAPKGPPPHPRP